MNLEITLANLVSPIVGAVEGIAPITAEALHSFALKGDTDSVLEMLQACDDAVDLNIVTPEKVAYAKGAINSVRMLVEAVEA